MKLPNVKRILKEDLGADVPQWTLGLIGPLNTFMETVYQTLNKNVTFTDNIASFLVEVTINTDASSEFTALSFLNQLKGNIRVQAVMICQVYEKSTFTPVACSGISWSTDGVNVTVDAINGLGASSAYVARLLIF